MHASKSNADLVAQLNHAALPCPFTVLGLHAQPDGKGLRITTWQPHAKSIEVFAVPQNTSLGMMHDEGNGLFTLDASRRKNPFLYQFRMVNHDGTCHTMYDTYQFQPLIKQHEALDATTLSQQLGAHHHRLQLKGKQSIDGVMFSLYAPHASSVSVVGDFNHWDGRINPMNQGEDHIWRLFIPAVAEGAMYKFEIHDSHGNLLPLKTDPCARQIEPAPGFAAIVGSNKPYKWRDGQWQKRKTKPHDKKQPMSIYEVHSGAFMRNEDNSFKNYRDLADVLIPYVQDLGFSHIELMPLAEYSQHEGWGYQSLGLFAPTSRHGSPQDLKYFIDQCHKANIGIILDWSIEAFPADIHGLHNLDGAALFEHDDPQQGWHPNWQACLYDFSSPWVQSYLISSALYWFDEFHVDGLKVHAVSSMLYLDYDRHEGEWTPNTEGSNENLAAFEFFKQLNKVVHDKHPNAMMIADDDSSCPNITRSLAESGLGFDYKWNHSWAHDSLQYMEQPNDQRPQHYTELTFGMVYAYNEDFILPLHHAFFDSAPIKQHMSGDDWQQFANVRAYLAFMFGHPAKKLLTMGNELVTDQAWHPANPINWAQADNPQSKQLQTMVRDLNSLYRKTAALHQLDYDRKGFQWLVMDDHYHSIVAFLRQDSKGKQVMVVCNMSTEQHNDYRIGLAKQANWQEVFNSDSQAYGGAGITNDMRCSEKVVAHEKPYSISLTLPPLSTLMLQS